MTEETKPEKTVDTTMPDGKWAFDGDVTAAFDDMLDRSIPLHDVMRDAVFTLGRTFVKPNTSIVDLGCSRGAALEPFVRAFGAHNRFLALDVSEPMLDAARERFEGLIKAKLVDVRNFDLRSGYPPVDASLTLSILTLQFTPIEHRQRILADVYDHTVPGGAFIIVEKILGATAKLDKLFVDRYYAMKREHGYSLDAIERKRLSLEGVLVPVTSDWNVELLRQAGFRSIDCFWRWCNFAAWIAVK